MKRVASHVSVDDTMSDPTESEWQTRKQRIDPLLTDAGWVIVGHDPTQPTTSLTKHAVREFPTDNGPADYMLFVDGRSLGVVEAKKLTGGPQGVLTQAERYSRGAFGSVVP